MVQKFDGDWRELRDYKPSVEVDFHRGPLYEMHYHEAMDQVEQEAMSSLVDAYQQGLPYLLVTHGSSTSRKGKTTTRSVIRKLFRSPKVTPYVNRRESIQHRSAFLFALKTNPNPAKPSKNDDLG